VYNNCVRFDPMYRRILSITDVGSTMANFLSIAWVFLFFSSIILIFFNGLWAFLIFILSCVVIAVWSNTPEGKTLLRKQEVEAKAIREKRAVDAKRAEIAAAKVIEEFSTIV
jgi:predicted membrane protein